MEKLQRYDAAYGIISSHSKNAAFVLLDNGETGVCFTARHIPVNTRILCSIGREATKERRHCVLKLESICNLYDAA